MRRHWGWVACDLSAVAALFAVLAAPVSVHAQRGVAGGDDARMEPAMGGVGVELLPPMPAGASGSSGTAGASGGSADIAGPGVIATMCESFPLCSQPQQGRGALVAFDISLAPEIERLQVDHVRVSLVVAGVAVSWSPRTLPDPTETVTLPFTTEGLRTCINQYGAGEATVEGLVGDKVVAVSGGTLDVAECTSLVVHVELQPLPSDSPKDASAGSADDDGAGSAAGQGGADAGQSAGAGGDDGGCGCGLIGATHARSSRAWLASALALAALGVRARRRRRG